MERQLAVSVIIESGGRYLLAERGHNPGKGQFAFPGGRVEPGEDLEQAARRELMEETGLVAGELVPVAEFQIDSHRIGFHLHVFAAKSFSGVPVAADDAAALGWYSPADMKALPMPQSMHDMLAKLTGNEADGKPVAT